jgi:hypothetical protein
LKKLFKKLLPLRIQSRAYIFKKNVKQDNFCMNYDLKIFTKNNKSGIKKIDEQLSNNNVCYAVFDNDLLIHTSWIFKKKLLSKQIGIRSTYIIGESHTIITYRGKGIYTNVLKIISSQKDKDIVIFVSPHNLSSVKAIEKAGFKKLYEFELMRFLGFKMRFIKYENRN